MSATELAAHHQQPPKITIPNENIVQVKPRVPYYQINPSYTLRVVCCVLFIFLTEICLTHYIYRLINTEIRDEYLLKKDFEQNLINALRSGPGRDEFLRMFKEFDRYASRTAKNSSASSSAPSARTKRDAYVLDDDNMWNVASDGPSLDVFRDFKDTEVKGDAERTKNGKKGEGVWLTSHNRISQEDIDRFCANTKDRCPAGPKGEAGPRGGIGPVGPAGPLGLNGPKGERGDTGFPGLPGPLGARGHPGPRGEKGSQGRPGLDGRDGVPGEPGFDGIPGRNGHDGTPGTDGLPGYPGKDGRNGTDGRPGLQGPQGPPGPQGSRGLTGPRGFKGRSGKDGRNGDPGICLYPMTTLTESVSDFVVAPSLATGSFNSTMFGPVIVEEGDNVTFHCAPSGIPTPKVAWKRLDEQPIVMGRRKDTVIESYTLNLTFVNRIHMGVYQCIANNGIPPQANQTFILEVHFKPLIRIRNQKIGTYNGSSATLECEVEAFPEAVRYWERSDGRLLENGEKYKIDESVDKTNYRVRMRLIITRINVHDFTEYYCIAKNEKTFEATKGFFTVYETIPGLVVPPSTEKIILIGSIPPENIPYESICPPAPQCTECLDQRECKDLALFDLLAGWEIISIDNTTNKDGPGNRSTNCILYAIGKPVYHRFTNETYGSWMRDLNVQEGEKYWSTREGNDSFLFEFANKTVFRRDQYTKYYKLNPAFRGNAHVVFNGSFFYVAKDEPKIVKHGMNNDMTTSHYIPLLQKHNDGPNLYKSGYNYMDLNIDDNGLWVIFGIPDFNNTGVIKMDPNNLHIQYIWNISLNHQRFGEMFIACGVLYAVDSVQDRNSKIRFALDLYSKNLLNVNLVFTNPFKNTTTVGYNHKNKELYTWDRGNQLTYPVRYNEMSPHIGGKEERTEQMAPLVQGLTEILVNNERL